MYEFPDFSKGLSASTLCDITGQVLLTGISTSQSRPLNGHRPSQALCFLSIMSASKSTDTSFRKTWDREEYAQKAAAREAKIKSEGAARAEAKAAGKKYFAPRASTPPDARETESRTSRLDVSQNVGKTTLVPAGAAMGKKGRGAGFYCPDCDLTFKDNLQFVEHLNSKQASDQYGAGLARSGRQRWKRCRERLAWLARKKREEMEGVGDVVELGKRLEVRKELDEKEREEKRQRRREKEKED